MSTTVVTLLVLCISALFVLSYLYLSVVMPQMDELASRPNGPTDEEEAKWAAEVRLQQLQAEEEVVRDRLRQLANAA